MKNQNPSKEDPILHHRFCRPVAVSRCVPDDGAFLGVSTQKIADLPKEEISPISRGDEILLDFGDHWVGYLTLKIGRVGYQDSPLRLVLRFAEIPAELTQNCADYDGWPNSSRFYEETVTVDALPAVVRLPRRYAFRYCRISAPKSHTAYSF